MAVLKLHRVQVRSLVPLVSDRWGGTRVHCIGAEGGNYTIRFFRKGAAGCLSRLHRAGVGISFETHAYSRTVEVAADSVFESLGGVLQGWHRSEGEIRIRLEAEGLASQSEINGWQVRGLSLVASVRDVHLVSGGREVVKTFRDALPCNDGWSPAGSLSAGVNWHRNQVINALGGLAFIRQRGFSEEWLRDMTAVWMGWVSPLVADAVVSYVKDAMERWC